MTFAELAAVRGTSKRAAVTLIRRHGWRRQRNNEGHVIALVPLTWAIPEEAREAHAETRGGPNSEAHITTFETALAAIEASHAAEVAALRAQADASEQGRVAMQELADRTMAQLADAGERISRLERDLTGALEVATKAVQAGDGLRADLAAAHQARAEAQEAAQSAAALRGELTNTQAELAQQRILTDQARQYASEQEQEAQKALQAAHELRRTEEARQARGRWARLRAAWRGE